MRRGLRLAPRLYYYEKTNQTPSLSVLPYDHPHRTFLRLRSCRWPRAVTCSARSPHGPSPLLPALRPAHSPRFCCCSRLFSWLPGTSLLLERPGNYINGKDESYYSSAAEKAALPSLHQQLWDRNRAPSLVLGSPFQPQRLKSGEGWQDFRRAVSGSSTDITVLL